MHRWEMSSLGLEKEFKKLFLGLELSSRSLKKIFSHFGLKGLKRVWEGFWWILESPKLTRKHGPGMEEEIPPYCHPPSLR